MSATEADPGRSSAAATRATSSRSCWSARSGQVVRSRIATSSRRLPDDRRAGPHRSAIVRRRGAQRCSSSTSRTARSGYPRRHKIDGRSAQHAASIARLASELPRRGTNACRGPTVASRRTAAPRRAARTAASTEGEARARRGAERWRRPVRAPRPVTLESVDDAGRVLHRRGQEGRRPSTATRASAR